jgi:L-amino acid N-acyltransferase YncA
MDAKLNSEAGEAHTAHRRAGPVIVRNSRDADIPAMLAIYLHHIRRGVEPGLDNNDFETPDAEDLKRRRKSMQRRRMPHIVAEEEGVVLGYAYARPIAIASNIRSTCTKTICTAA